MLLLRIVWNIRISGVVLSSCAFLLLLLPHTTNAALLYFDPSEASLYRGDTVTLNLRIDTDEGECINTIDAVVKYGEGIRAVDVSRGDSILNIWVEDPVINEENKTVTFAGGLPGGYCGRALGDPSLTNVVAAIVFSSPGFSVGGTSVPTVAVEVAPESQVLLHDGLGTVANLNTQGTKITLLATPGETNNDTWRDAVSNDVVPPADFSVAISQDETAFSNQYFIVFNTQDKQSGIDHYEVMEEPLEDFYSFTWGRADAPWVTVESPYVLKDQTLNSTIRVKAIDKAGNERITVLVPDSAIRTISFNRMMTYGLGGVAGVILLMGIIYILIKRKSKLEATYE